VIQVATAMRLMVLLASRSALASRVWFSSLFNFCVVFYGEKFPSADRFQNAFCRERFPSLIVVALSSDLGQELFDAVCARCDGMQPESYLTVYRRHFLPHWSVAADFGSLLKPAQVELSPETSRRPLR
jgi:hypothetical protein